MDKAGVDARRFVVKRVKFQVRSLGKSSRN
jgi:hypothetical protein